jgi:hypothetical protein
VKRSRLLYFSDIPAVTLLVVLEPPYADENLHGSQAFHAKLLRLLFEKGKGDDYLSSMTFRG